MSPCRGGGAIRDGWSGARLTRRIRMSAKRSDVRFGKTETATLERNPVEGIDQRFGIEVRCSFQSASLSNGLLDFALTPMPAQHLREPKPQHFNERLP